MWHEAGLSRTSMVPISMTGMARMGISRFAASRGLRALEKAGLVCVVRRPGRKPVVTILATAPLTEPVLLDGVELAEIDKVVGGPDEKGSSAEKRPALGEPRT
jgi:DNA-binding transcriptional ArsR family regulator